METFFLSAAAVLFLFSQFNEVSKKLLSNKRSFLSWKKREKRRGKTVIGIKQQVCQQHTQLLSADMIY